MKKTDLISIIIPAYNVAEYIEECVKSVCRQTYLDIEIIIVDDGSTDGTGKVCKQMSQHDSRIRVITQKNQGVVTARDNGLNAAKGTFVAFVDGDDWIEPDMISHLYESIGDAGMSSCGVFQERSKGEVLHTIDRYDEGAYESNTLNKVLETMLYDESGDYLHRITSWIYNKLYLRDMAIDIHRRVDKELKFAEDSVFLYQYILQCKKIVIKHDCKYHYRYREGSAIHKRDDDLLTKANQVYNALRPVFENYPEYRLVYQLQCWVRRRVCFGMAEIMRFDEAATVEQYVLDMKPMIGKRCVIYGAGRVGKALKRQADSFGYEIALWVDKNWADLRKKGLDVHAPEELQKSDFDLVCIAIEDERIVSRVMDYLLSMGIARDRIIHTNLIKLY